MRNDRLHELLARYFQKIHTPEERSELLKMLEQPENESIVKEWIDKGFSENLPFDLDPTAEHDILQAILQVKVPEAPGTGNSDTPLSIRPAHRVYFLRRWGWAAASILVLVIGVSRWRNSRKTANTSSQTTTTTLQNNVLPGGQRATLTLADGTTLSLDSAGNGLLARQGGTSIRKLASGQVAYEPSGAAAGTAGTAYNTMSTPRGGQYQLTLPDGTKVWLNAASSIRYPVDFSGAERRVEITGEAYFEVAKDAARPFIVKQDETKSHQGALEIRVLGTQFNVNAYEDEGAVQTTLLQGSIQVSVSGKTVLVKPGEQASLQAAGGLSLTDAVDPEQVIAWKSGFFEFHKMDLPAILRQISRWYNVDIRYTRPPGAGTFGGRVSKNVGLATVLKGLGITGVGFKMEGNTLVVEP